MVLIGGVLITLQAEYTLTVRNVKPKTLSRARNGLIISLPGVGLWRMLLKSLALS